MKKIQFTTAIAFWCIASLALGTTDAHFVLDSGTCILPGVPGFSCDDGDAGTFNDVYLSDSCTCAGTDYVNPDGSGPCAGASHITYDGYDYRLVEVGTQCWYQENVRQLPAVFSPAQTFPTYDTVDPRAWVYGYDGTDVDSALTLSSYQEFGPLYNHAAATQWNLCPSGWNLPSVNEWTVLLDTLGGVDEAASVLKASVGWDGTNAVGFEALPAGQRNLYTGFNGINESAYFWTSTTGDFPYAFAVSLTSDDAPVGVGSTGNHDGFSIRCVKGIPGCTNSGACNYDTGATLDDETCILEGCNDPYACNFNGADICDLTCIYPLVGEDCNGVEGMCGPGTYWNATEQQCEVTLPGDTDFDNCIYVNDLLGLLSAFGACQEVGAVEFDCGLDKVNYQGFPYATIQIGEDCWFAENLRATAFVNGDSIPTGLSGSDWAGATSPAYAVYGDGDGLTENCCPGDGPESDDEVYNLEVYGRLYNGWAKNDPRGLCPSGWHISDISDWDDLVSHFGGYSLAGNALKGQDSLFVNWQPQGVEHFGALPAGYRDQAAGLYYYRGADAGFWTAQGSQHRRMNGGAQMLANNVSLKDGYSIRCVKD